MCAFCSYVQNKSRPSISLRNRCVFSLRLWNLWYAHRLFSAWISNDNHKHQWTTWCLQHILWIYINWRWCTIFTKYCLPDSLSATVICLWFKIAQNKSPKLHVRQKMTITSLRSNIFLLEWKAYKWLPVCVKGENPFVTKKNLEMDIQQMNQCEGEWKKKTNKKTFSMELFIKTFSWNKCWWKAP